MNKERKSSKEEKPLANCTKHSFSISSRLCPPSQFLIKQIEDTSATTIQAQKSNERGGDEIKVKNAHRMSGCRAELKGEVVALCSEAEKSKWEEILGRRRNAITSALYRPNRASSDISEDMKKEEVVNDKVVVELGSHEGTKYTI